MPRKKKRPDNAKSRRNAQVFFVLNISLLIVLWILTRFYYIPPVEILVFWILVTTIMIVLLWYIDRKAARMVLEDLSRGP